MIEYIGNEFTYLLPGEMIVTTETISKNQPEFWFNIESHQHLIDLIQEPCFMLLDDTGNKYIVNRFLAKFLKYGSLTGFYKQVPSLFQIIDSHDISRIKKVLRGLRLNGSSGSCNLLLNIKNRPALKCRIKLDSFRSPVPDSLPIWFGRIVLMKSKSNYQIDKSILNLFNDDRFLDEVIVIMDFKGNIISANRKFYMIDFFTDFSQKRPNLFKVIDKSYQPILLRRIALLKKGIPAPPAEFRLAAENGKSAYVEVYSKATMYKNQNVIVSLIRDISIRKETEKKLLYAVVQTEEKERQRFAQDLHDELGPFLSGLKLYLHELNAQDTDDERRKMLIDYLGQMINEAVDKIRTLSSNLMPQNMIDAGLSASIEKLIDQLNQTGRITIRQRTEGQETGIEKAFVITLYRIVLELINNSIKHSGSDKVDITIIFQKAFVRLIYKDNGKGFELEKTLRLNKGIGLKSILNRVDLYQGICRFRKRRSGGIEFDLYFPLK